MIVIKLGSADINKVKLENGGTEWFTVDPNTETNHLAFAYELFKKKKKKA